MGFFHSPRQELPLRGPRGKRLKLLQQFEVGRLYTFDNYHETDLPDDLPFGVLIEEIGDDYCERHCV